MKKEKINNEIQNCRCPLGSLSILTRKLGKLFREHFNKLDVTTSQAQLFLLLNETEELFQSEISKKLELDRSTVSRDLMRLIDKGYLYKAKGGSSPKIGLTKSGKEFAKLINEEWKKGYEDSLSFLGDGGLKALQELENQVQSKNHA